MNTYRYLGLKAPKFYRHADERQAHAVAYSSTLPRDTEDDHLTANPAIAVKPFSLSRTLDKKSRVHLGSLHTVQKNLQVREMGDVIDFEQLKRTAQPFLEL